MEQAKPTNTRPDVARPVAEPRRSVWLERYAAKHRLRRVRDTPAGIRLPRRVRLYARGDHFLLQWWDKREKRTLNERVEGDLVAAISRTGRLTSGWRISSPPAESRGSAIMPRWWRGSWRTFGGAPTPARLTSRPCAGIRPPCGGTSCRLSSSPASASATVTWAPWIGNSTLALRRHLNHVQVSPNGHPHAKPRPLKRPAFILDVLRAMLEWAADPERGDLLSEGFRNPFARRLRKSRQVANDLLKEPDITAAMAAELMKACDRFQLAIFAPLALFGLRPGEIGWLFREYVKDDWIDVPCNLDLDYVTKGRREKGFPLSEALCSLWRCERSKTGLLYLNRQSRKAANARRRSPASPWRTWWTSIAAVAAQGGPMNAERRRKIRNALMKEAGQLNYDHVEAEFRKLSQRLAWPAHATLKDLRHLFSTCLENAGVPQFYRCYLKGQSFGRSPIVTYTHITEDQVRKHYAAALQGELAAVVDAIQNRATELGVPGG